MPLVRTTIEPDREIEVSASEATDLGRLGLLVEDAPATKGRKATTEKGDD